MSALFDIPDSLLLQIICSKQSYVHQSRERQLMWDNPDSLLLAPSAPKMSQVSSNCLYVEHDIDETGYRGCIAANCPTIAEFRSLLSTCRWQLCQRFEPPRPALLTLLRACNSVGYILTLPLSF